MTTIIEHVTYKLAPQASLEQLQQTHDGVNQFCLSQPGFLYRSLSQDKDQVWHDIVYWQDMQTAQAAGEAFMQTAECVALAELCDKQSLNMQHMAVETQVFPEQA